MLAQIIKMLGFAEKIGFISRDQIDGALPVGLLCRPADERVIFLQIAEPELIDMGRQAAAQQSFLRQGQMQSGLLSEEMLEQEHLLIADVQCCGFDTQTQSCSRECAFVDSAIYSVVRWIWRAIDLACD